MAIEQYEMADNMTDRLAALTALVHTGATETVAKAQGLITDFYETFADEPLVIDKWFTLLATSPTTDTAAVRKLMAHPAFTLKNPNRARSLVFGFCNANMAQFHAEDGSGYQLWRDVLTEIRMMDRWKRYIPSLKEKAQETLEAVAKGSLSKDTREIISKSLGQ